MDCALVCCFGLDCRLTAATVFAAVVVGLSAGLVGDAPGWLLFGGVVLLLVGYAVTDLVFWLWLVVF